MSSVLQRAETTDRGQADEIQRISQGKGIQDFDGYIRTRPWTEHGVSAKSWDSGMLLMGVEVPL